jgi:hypothetical protein
MTFLDAAIAVLSKADRPLTAEEIVRLALEQRLLTSSGRTPEATMSAALYVEARLEKARVHKVAEPGRVRAQRGSVSWIIAPPHRPATGKSLRGPKSREAR